MQTIPQASVFSRIDLRASGWTDSSISRAVRSGRLIRLRRDQFSVLAGDPRIAAVAAARSCAGSVISHRSAALLLGIPLLGRLPRVPELTVPPFGTGDVQGATLRRATLREEDIVVWGDVPTTSPARTAFDLARHSSTIAGVAALDYVLHWGLATWDEFDELALLCWNWPRIRRALRALRLADERSESPLESMSRIVMGWMGLPAPRPQIRIFDEGGRFRGRVDFYWDEFGVAGEADGKLKYGEIADVYGEKERHEVIEDLHLFVVRWSWNEMSRAPRTVKGRLERGFRRGQLRDRSGFPRLWSARESETGHQRGERDQIRLARVASARAANSASGG